MSGPQALLAHASKLGLLVLLAGVVWRERSGQCWSFVLYVAATLVGNTLATVRPDLFFTPAFTVQKQLLYDVLKAMVALELAQRALTAFPGALRTVRLNFAIVLGLILIAQAWLTPRGSYATIGTWEQSIATGDTWLFTVTALVVTWYNLPIGRWPRAIMLGFAPYLLVFVILLRVLQRRGWSFPFGLYDSLAWLGLLAFWAYAAWRRDDAPLPANLDASAANA